MERLCQHAETREEKESSPGVIGQEVIDIFPRFKSVCARVNPPWNILTLTMCTGVRARELFARGTIKPFLWGSETTLGTVLLRWLMETQVDLYGT